MQTLAPKDFFPQRGERSFTVGSTGGGKSKFMRWMLPYVDITPIVIYDTKGEESFNTLERSRIVERHADIAKAAADVSIDYVIYRPAVNLLADKGQMDNMLFWHYNNLPRTGLLIDELTDFTNQVKPGMGLLAILSRGRSRGITAMLCTQRPAWIPMICITEAQKYFIFRIKPRDMEKIGDCAGIPPKIENGKKVEFGDLQDPPEFGFWFYSARLKEPELFKPIRLEHGTDTGYVDGDHDAALRRSFIWL